MLVDPNDRAVDHGAFEIRIAGQRIEQNLQNTFRRPAAEPSEDRIPSPEIRMQITPRRAGARDPKTASRAAVVVAAATGMAGLLGSRGAIRSHGSSLKIRRIKTCLLFRASIAPPRELNVTGPSEDQECQTAIIG